MQTFSQIFLIIPRRNITIFILNLHHFLNLFNDFALHFIFQVRVVDQRRSLFRSNFLFIFY